MLYNSPKSVLDEVAKIIKESKTKYDKEMQEQEDARKALWEKKMGKKPLHPNQQKLDVHEPEKDELTGKDFEILRAGKKNMKKEEAELKEAKGLAGMTMDQLKQEHDKVKKRINDEGVSKMISMNHPLSQRARSIRLHMAIREKQGRLKEEKNKDTPGQHMCAIHVKNEQFGEGKTIPGQHAEPDDQGMIAWYDVMFEEGIIKNVPTTELEILVSEAHKNHRKMKMEELKLDEARGRPRKSPAPMGSDDEGEEPDQNIVNHLKKSIDTGGNHEVKFSDGKKHKVPSHVAKKVLGAMGKLKPDDRLEIQKHIQQNHSNLMQVHGMIK